MLGSCKKNFSTQTTVFFARTQHRLYLKNYLNYASEIFTQRG